MLSVPARLARKAVLLLCLAAPGVARAESASEVDRLLALEFGRLLDVRVSLATRTDRRLFNTASAVAVLSREDIERAGFTRLVDVLRLLPGVHVGRGNANQYGVAIRNGMNRFSSTALVMIDGRHVYTPLFGGVRWETQELPLDRVERIEVVRGPGGPLWGANAVDGIIHVITREASPADGASAALLAGGGELRRDAAVSWSDGDAAARWRLDLRALEVDAGEYLPASLSTHRGRLVAGDSANDGGDGWTLRGRLDGDAGPAAWSVQLGASAFRFGEQRALPAGPRPNSVDHGQRFATLDWRHPLGAGDALRLRLSAEQATISDDILDESQTLVDVDLQTDVRRGAHLLTVGGGWRHYRSDARRPPGLPCVACFGLSPAVRTVQTANLFLQDQWTLSPEWMAIAGFKLEANSERERNWQPTLRLNWEPDGRTTVWAALTRPVRTPTRADRDTAFFEVPAGLVPAFGCRQVEGSVCLAGNPDAPAWTVEVAEAGWRQRLGERADLDATVFSSDYDFRVEAPTPVSLLGQRIHGVELAARWRASRHWQLGWHSSWHRGRERLGDGRERAVSLMPRQSHLLRAGAQFGAWTVDLLWSRVGDVTRPASAGLPAITLPDREQTRLRLAWRTARAGEWSLVLGGLGTEPRGEYLEGAKVNTAPRPTWALSWKSGR